MAVSKVARIEAGLETGALNAVLRSQTATRQFKGSWVEGVERGTKRTTRLAPEPPAAQGLNSGSALRKRVQVGSVLTAGIELPDESNKKGGCRNAKAIQYT